MGKFISILGACVAVAGGAAFGLYTYTTVSCERVDPSTCPVVRAGCCAQQTECGTSAGDETTPALAVAGGPAALFATVPVKAEVSACCATKAVAKATCCDDVKLVKAAACCSAPCADCGPGCKTCGNCTNACAGGGLSAVAGAVVTTRK